MKCFGANSYHYHKHASYFWRLAAGVESCLIPGGWHVFVCTGTAGDQGPPEWLGSDKKRSKIHADRPRLEKLSIYTRRVALIYFYLKGKVQNFGF